MKHRIIALPIALALAACLPLKAQIVSTRISGYGAESSEGAIAEDDLPVFLIDPLSQSLVDSAKVIDGRFNITAKDSVDKLMLLRSTGKNFVFFFNDGTPMEVKLGDCKIQKGSELDSKADAWKKAIAELGMNWPQLSDLKGGKSPVVAVYGLQSIPYSVLINGDGKIVARRLRGSALQDKLKEIYGY